MNYKHKIIKALYKNIFKPLAFKMDAEFIHDSISKVGESLESCEKLVSFLLSYQDLRLKKTVLGVSFSNPIGLAAGFDYDGHLAEIMKYVGFGFNTVGTVTAKPYVGNKKPRLARLPKSRSLLVNKGFKSEGAVVIASRLDTKNLSGRTIGISVGSTNSPSITTINKAIDDYLFTFNLFKRRKYVKYFELNISCPNTTMTESFAEEKNFRALTKAVVALKIKQPIFIKMPNEINEEECDKLVRVALSQEIRGFIFSNLVKNRNNQAFDKKEIKYFSNFIGNFSGKPTVNNANKLLAHVRNKFGKEATLVGCGGVFNANDVVNKLNCGADLVQLITGMIFEGPQLIGEICQELTSSS